MNRLLLALVALCLWAIPALAQFITPASMRDANLTPATNVNFVTTLNTFTAQRTLTLPGAGGLSAYYFQFTDTANAINGGNTLRIVAADGSNINGASALVVSTPGAYLYIVPSPGGYAATVIPPTASGGGGTPGGTSGQTQYNNVGAFGGYTPSGDLTVNPTTGAFTLATVNANVGIFGSATSCVTTTQNAKGLTTAISAVTCTPALGSITGFGTGVATALAINIGTTGAPVLFNGAGGTPSAIALTNGTGLPTTALINTLQAAQEPAHTGDVTNSAGSLALALATVNGNVGTFGSSTNCVTFTVNAKGLITAASQTACAGAGTSTLVPPQGRLTLVTNTPVMTATPGTFTTLRYDCYVGPNVPYYNGSTDLLDTITSCEVTDALVSAATAGQVVSGQVYDVWWAHGGANRICLAMSTASGGGGGWASDTGGSNTARGTGYTQLDRSTRSYTTNKNSITNCMNAATNYGPISANQGTYLGTVYSNANGQIAYTFGASTSGGTAGLIGIWNMYNRVHTTSVVTDSGASYTYTTASIRQARASAGNQTQFVSGLAEDAIAVTYTQRADTVGAIAAIVSFGIGFDSTSSFFQQRSTVLSQAVAATTAANTNAANIPPQIGFHTVAGVELGDGTNANTFNTDGRGVLTTMIFN